jgi:NADPH-dependent 7-cyano-7-deazaguanine reductase QueF
MPLNNKNEVASENLKMSISKYQNMMDSHNDIMKNIVKEEILS